MAKNDNLSVSLTADIDAFKKGLSDASKILQKEGKNIEKAAAEMALNVSQKIEKMSIKSQARQLENLTAKMMEMGMDGTKAFQQVTSAAGQLKAQIDDAKGVIDAMRPDAPFQALSTTLTASAQAFAGVQGAMALFGAESEDVQKTLLKVQAAMAFAEGFKALDGLSDGFQQLNMVIKANPLIAGIAAFTAAAAAITAVALSTDDLTAAQENNLIISEKAMEMSVKERSEMEQLIRVYNDRNTTDEEKLAIQQQLINKFPEYFGQLSKEKVEIEKTTSAITNYINVLKLKAQAQASEDLYIEKLKELYKVQKEIGSSADKLKSNFYILGVETASDEAMAIKKEIADIEKSWDKAAKAAAEAELAQTKAFGATTAEPATRSPKTKTRTTGSSDWIDKYVAEKKKVTDLENYQATAVERGRQGVKAYGSQIEKATKELEKYKQTILTIPGLQEKTDASMQKLKQSFETVEIAAAELNALIENSLESAVYNMAAAFGEAAAMGQNVGQAVGQTLLMGLADFVMQMGKMMIAAGIAWDGFIKSLATNPVAAVALGIAAVAAGAALKAHVTKGAQVQKFADGGIVDGNSYTGDKVHAMVNSGEMILNKNQQSNLLSMINSGMTGGGGYIASTRIDGRDLYLVVEKAKKDLSR